MPWTVGLFTVERIFPKKPPIRTSRKAQLIMNTHPSNTVKQSRVTRQILHGENEKKPVTKSQQRSAHTRTDLDDIFVFIYLFRLRCKNNFVQFCKLSVTYRPLFQRPGGV